MFEILNKNKKGLITLFMMFFLGLTTLFAAGDFDNVNKVVEETDKAVQTTAGIGMTNYIAFSPLIFLIIGAFMGWKKGVKDAKQEQEDSNKALIFATMGGVGGAIIAILIIALIGAVLMQDSSKGLLVLKNYWQSALSLTGS